MELPTQKPATETTNIFLGAPTGEPRPEGSETVVLEADFTADVPPANPPDSSQAEGQIPLDRGAGKERRRPRRRGPFVRAVGSAAVVLGIGLASGGAACHVNPDPPDCALRAAAETCWDLNTGVLRPDDGSGIERWTTAQILSGQAGLEHITGTVEITTDDAVYENKWIDGCIAVKANRVHIKNVLVRGGFNCAGGFNGSDVALISTGSYEGQNFPRPTDLLVTDSVIIGTNPVEDLAGIGQTDYTAFNNDISQTTKGFRANTNVNISGNYVHNLADGTHHGEAFFMAVGADDQPGGAANVNIINNWMKANSNGLNSGAMAFYNEYAGVDVSKVRVEHNYLDGDDNGVGIRGGAYINKPGNFYFDFVVKDNVIEHNDAGIWTAREAEAWCNTCPGNEWTNNNEVDGTSGLTPIDAPTPITG